MEPDPNPDEAVKPSDPIHQSAIQQPKPHSNPMSEKDLEKAKGLQRVGFHKGFFSEGFAPVLLLNTVFLGLGILLFDAIHHSDAFINILFVVCLLQIPIGIFANRRVSLNENDDEKYFNVKSGITWAIALTLLVCAVIFLFFLPGLLCGMALNGIAGSPK